MKAYPYRVTVNLTAEVGAQLEDEAKKQDRSVAWVIRNSLTAKRTTLSEGKQ
jgi:hypothetical protein